MSYSYLPTHVFKLIYIKIWRLLQLTKQVCGRNITLNLSCEILLYLRQHKCCFSTGFFHWAQRVVGALASDWFCYGVDSGHRKYANVNHYLQRDLQQLLDVVEAGIYRYQTILRNLEGVQYAYCVSKIHCTWSVWCSCTTVFNWRNPVGTILILTKTWRIKITMQTF